MRNLYQRSLSVYVAIITSLVDADVPIAVTGVALLVLFVKLMLLFFAVAHVTDALL